MDSSLFSLPGQPATGDGSLEQAAAECIKKLTGIKEFYLEQLHTYGEPNCQADERMISIVYFALLPAASETDDFPAREKAVWQSIEPTPGLIWNHTVILQYALRRLRYKLKYSAVGF